MKTHHFVEPGGRIMKAFMRSARCLIPMAASLCMLQAHAQLAEKPSTLLAERIRVPVVTAPGESTRAPYLDQIGSRTEFERIARIYNPGTPRAIVHTIFALDRMHGDRLYYINARRYRLHEDFLRKQYLVAGLDHNTLAGYYTRPDRRFVLGTVSFLPDVQQWVYEFWEGDRLTPSLLQLTHRRLTQTFFAPLTFKANSAQHESVAGEAGLAALTEAQILGERSFLPLNTGNAQGRLRLVADIESDEEDDIAPTDIVVLREVPLALPPVAGVLTEKPSTVLSHVNLLAKGWGVPNAYVKDAFEALQRYDGQWVKLSVRPNGYSVEPVAKPVTLRQRARATALRAPNLAQRALRPLTELRERDAGACGGKATRLGQIEAARRAGKLAGVAPVPDGFCIPYAQYVAFMRQPQVMARVQAALATPGFERSRRVRRQALDALRKDLVEMPVDETVIASWIQRWQQQLGSAGVFVRSSSNSEDLSNFSGAGLYSTVPNVREATDLVRAVQTVWASVFNFEAYEARRQAGIAPEQVVMAVFVQHAVDSVSSGVMITRDPFDVTHRNAVYVSAKRGLGIKVVEGRRVAEQSMYDARSGAVRRLSRSDEDTELKLDAAGGAVEKPLEGQHEVLDEATVRSLARVGRQLKRLLHGKDQDIEWAIDPQGRIVVLQARPYIERKVL